MAGRLTRTIQVVVLAALGTAWLAKKKLAKLLVGGVKSGSAAKLLVKARAAAKAVIVFPLDNAPRLFQRSFDDVLTWIIQTPLSLKLAVSRKAAEAAGPEAVSAAYDMTQEVSGAFSPFFKVFSLTGSLCIIAVAAATLPLLWRLLVRRRPKIFISFHHNLEPVSEEMQESLNRSGFKAERIPFDAGAQHQEVLGRTREAARACRAMVCLPGSTGSWLANEVHSVATLQKAIVFAVPKSGHLPDTADKRYPVFRLERAMEREFGSMSHFLHYVTADFRSALSQARESLKSPFVSISWMRSLVAGLSVGVALFLVCFFQAFEATGPLVEKGGDVYADQRLRIVLSGTMVLLLFASLVLPAAAFTGLASRSYWRQWLAQRKARLKTRTAEFVRDDWIGVVPGLEPGSYLYECLYESAPLAHHEVEGTQ